MQVGNKNVFRIEKLYQEIGTRAFIVGKTGSGKSRLAKVLVDAAYTNQPVIVIDAKGTWPIPEYGELWHGVKYDCEGDYIVYRPEMGADIEHEINEICKMIYENAQNGFPCFVYIDELIPILGRDTVQGSRYLKFLYTQGRQLGVTMLAGTQRPSSVPQYLMTESEYLYCFKLRNIKDRERMADYFGDEFGQPIDKYWFRFYSEDLDVYPDLLKLPPDMVF